MAAENTQVVQLNAGQLVVVTAAWTTDDTGVGSVRLTLSQPALDVVFSCDPALTYTLDAPDWVTGAAFWRNTAAENTLRSRVIINPPQTTECVVTWSTEGSGADIVSALAQPF